MQTIFLRHIICALPILFERSCFTDLNIDYLRSRKERRHLSLRCVAVSVKPHSEFSQYSLAFVCLKWVHLVQEAAAGLPLNTTGLNMMRKHLIKHFGKARANIWNSIFIFWPNSSWEETWDVLYPFKNVSVSFEGAFGNLPCVFYARQRTNVVPEVWLQISQVCQEVWGLFFFRQL